MNKRPTPLELAKFMAEENRKFFENAEEYLNLIYKAAKEELPDAKVYLFGSFYRGDYHPCLSDIDVAVVSEKVPKSPSKISLIKGRILKKAGMELYSPFQLHVLRPNEWEFYRRFVGNEFKEIGGS